MNIGVQIHLTTTNSYWARADNDEYQTELTGESRRHNSQGKKPICIGLERTIANSVTKENHITGKLSENQMKQMKFKIKFKL